MSFLERIDAMRAYAAAELALLRKRQAELRELAADRAAADATTRETLAKLSESLPDASALGAAVERDGWVWLVAGVVTQEFGPTTLALEPARTVDGVAQTHFHEGLDIAAPLLASVRGHFLPPSAR